MVQNMIRFLMTFLIISLINDQQQLLAVQAQTSMTAPPTPSPSPGAKSYCDLVVDSTEVCLPYLLENSKLPVPADGCCERARFIISSDATMECLCTVLSDLNLRIVRQRAISLFGFCGFNDPEGTLNTKNQVCRSIGLELPLSNTSSASPAPSPSVGGQAPPATSSSSNSLHVHMITGTAGMSTVVPIVVFASFIAILILGN